jgi:biotin transport system substrate-specific component
MKSNHTSKKLTIRELCHIGIFVAIIAVCAQIQIPTPLGVPLTLQTFALMLTGIILAKKNGTIAALAYVLIGAFGVPVFSSFSGGLGIVFGRTGGFILSFPFLVFAAGIGGSRDNRLWLGFWLILGCVINFTCGVLMFSFVTSMTFLVSFSFAVAPFIIPEIIKILILIIFGSVIKNRLKKSGVIL